MTVYMYIKMLGVVISITGTPYTMEECVKSLQVLKLPVELQVEAHCSYDTPQVYTPTPEQQKTIDDWTALNRS